MHAEARFTRYQVPGTGVATRYQIPNLDTNAHRHIGVMNGKYRSRLFGLLVTAIICWFQSVTEISAKAMFQP